MLKQQKVFAIGIPTINRADLLQPTLEKLQNDFPNTAIYIVDNGNQEWDVSKFTNDNVFFIRNDVNAGVSASWNQLLNAIYNGTEGFAEPCNFALILNDDIYLGKTEDEVIRFIASNQNISLATTTGTWCAFILQKLIYEKVGGFDEAFFPAYFEDNDYAYRLLISGFPHSSHEFLNPQVYRNSQTIAKNPALNSNFEKNKSYFVQKWGGKPGMEIYLSPFGNPDTF